MEPQTWSAMIQEDADDYCICVKIGLLFSDHSCVCKIAGAAESMVGSLTVL